MTESKRKAVERHGRLRATGAAARRFAVRASTAALLLLCPATLLAQPEPSNAGAADAEPAVASEPMRRPRGLSLRRCVELAVRQYPKVQEAQARLAGKRAQRDVARYQPYSDFTLNAILTPTPLERHDVRNPDPVSTSAGSDVTAQPNGTSTNLVFSWQTSLTGTIPLWTFGKITNTWDAADANISVGEHEVKKEQNDVKLSVRRAYYGVQLARDGLAIVRDALKRVDRYLPQLERKVQAGEADELDLLRVQMTRAELEARESEARQKESVALAGLGFLTGLGAAVEVPDVPLKRVRHELSSLQRYVAAARLYRPEVNMARAGVLAREAQLRAERAKYFPDIGLVLGAGWIRIPDHVDERNPLVGNRNNVLGAGAALGLRWKLDFPAEAGRVAQAEALVEEVRATERYALGGVGFEVEQAFREAEDARRRLDAWTRAAGFARRWVIQVQQAIDVGTMEERDLISPAKEYALKRFSQMSAIFDYNMALAKLALVTGWDAVTADD